MTFGKKQLLVGVLVAALGAAVYLNWQFSAVQPVETAETAASDTKELGQTVYVNTEVSGQTAAKSSANKKDTADKTKTNTSDNAKTDTANAKSAKPAAAEASTASLSQQDYFTMERQRRQTARDEAAAALADMMSADDTTENTKKEAIAAAERLASVMKSESDMEAEIKTKGFADCLVSINNGHCTVIVPSEGLNEATAVTIKDIVNRQSGIDFDKITITGR